MKRSRTNGFTFVELLVVVSIIGIIFAAGVVSFTSLTVRSRDTRRKADLEVIRQALEMCRSLTAKYPDDIIGDVTCGVGGTVLLTKTPEDPKPCGTPAVSTYTYSRSSDTVYTLSAPCMEIDTTYQVTNP
jgi:prepilin-type N-terminal cleavage/methylation domain-containing protein